MREESLFLCFYFPIELALARACPHPHLIPSHDLVPICVGSTRHPAPCQLLYPALTPPLSPFAGFVANMLQICRKYEGAPRAILLHAKPTILVHSPPRSQPQQPRIRLRSIRSYRESVFLVQHGILTLPRCQPSAGWPH